MEKSIIHMVRGLVEVSWRPEYESVYLNWFKEFDEGNAVKHAVLTALKWVKENRVKHWIADVSHSSEGLSDADFDWVSGPEFRTAVLQSGLKKFVLIPPLPETGQDTSWVSEWESNTLSKFGSQVSAKVCTTEDEVRSFLFS